MDFDFNINALFNNSISIITGKPNFPQRHQTDRHQLLKQLEHVIDTIGIKSAHAQRLSAPITSWKKIQINSHKVYILKEPLANNDLGSVLGFIKIGHKQLFVLDREGNHNEFSPLCVLDFYIHESQQRKGFGLRLFKYMLEEEAVKPSHLAIDRPSTKFMAFLRKHFNLWATIPQVNNFVVFDAFFKNRTDMKRSANRQYGRYQDEQYTELRPVSRAVSDDYIKRNRRNPYETNQGDNSPGSGTVIGRNTKYSILGDNTMQYSQSHTSSCGNGLGARANMYSRFNVEANNNVSSIPPSRKLVWRMTDEDMVTNPYRRVTNNHSKHTNSEIEISKIQSSENGDNNFRKANKLDNHESTMAYGNPAESKSRSQGQDEIHNKDFNMIAQPAHVQEEIVNSVKENRYKNPADMLLELKKKDWQSLHNNNRRFARSRTSQFGSSFNLFGVPMKSHLHKKFD